MIIAGPLVTRDDGFRHLRRLRTQSPDMKLVLAVDRWRSGVLRDTVRTGTLEILRLPVSDDDLGDAVEQALEIGQSAAAGRAATSVPVAGRGTVMAVVSRRRGEQGPHRRAGRRSVLR